MSKLCRAVLVVAILGATASMAMAEGDEGTPTEIEPPATAVSWPAAIAIVGGCIGAGACAIGGGYAIAMIGSKCIESIARQPEAAGTMFAPMIVSAAMVEGGMLFGIVVCMLAVLK